MSTQDTLIRFAAFDLETTSTDVATAEVVQAGVVFAASKSVAGTVMPDLSLTKSHEQLCYVAHVPDGAAEVHGIAAADVAGERPFAAYVAAYVDALTRPGVVACSYNGLMYDIPIIAHALAAVTGEDAATIETRIAARHVDVMRVHARYRAANPDAAPPWLFRVGAENFAPELTVSMFARTLTAVHGFWLGRGFEGAHGAAVDCKATLAVLGDILHAGVCTIDEAIAWSNAPLPGDVDFAGKFKWQGDQAVIAFGKHDGTPLESVDAGYLRWMMSNDFHQSTKTVISEYLAGRYPVRHYEDET